MGERLADLDAATVAFQAVRPRLFGVAYRMLGTSAEAEDVVQDAWLRWQSTDRSVVNDATGFLITTVTRLAINSNQSARAQRETYIGPWLPEPVDTSDDPLLGAERAEALNAAVLLLLERLSPQERAAYVLREAFAYSHREIAEVLDTTEANARQITTRARRHVDSERHEEVSHDEQESLLMAFLKAAQTGDVAALEAMFADSVVSLSDGGGKVTAARVPVVGRDRVAKFITSFATHFWRDVRIERIHANGRPAAIVWRGDEPVVALAIDAAGGSIRQMQWVLNPDKLKAVSHN